VLDLGATRKLVYRLVLVFPHVCKLRFTQLGSTKAACRVVKRRFHEMGQLSQASMLAPG